MEFFLICVLAVLCIWLYLQRKGAPNCSIQSKEEVRQGIQVPGADSPAAGLPDHSGYTENYNFRRAMEFIEQGNDNEAFEYFKKAIEDDNRNGYAHAWIGQLYFKCGNYGMALKAVNTAIGLLSGTNLVQYYTLRARINHSLRNLDAWKSDSEMAMQEDPSATDPITELSDYYYEQRMFDESNRQIDKYILLEPSNPYGYMVKGRNQLMKNNLDEALELFEYAHRLDMSYGPAYSFMADVYIQEGQMVNAVENAVQALDIMLKNNIEDNKAIYVRNVLAAKAYPLFCIKIKAQMAKSEDKTGWFRLLGAVRSISCHYREAARCYQEAYNLGQDISDLTHEAYCWQRLGYFKKAAQLTDKAIEEDPDNMELRQRLMLLKAEMGCLEEASSIGEYILQYTPDDAVIHFNCGRVQQLLGDHKSAIKSFDTVLLLTGNKNANALLFRAVSKESIGDLSGAYADLESITKDPEMNGYDKSAGLAQILLEEIDPSLTVDGSFRHEAVMTALNNDVTAALSTAKDSSDATDAAIDALVARLCVTSRLGKTDEALADMKMILSLGGRRFFIYRHSFQFAALQRVDRFETLLSEYESGAADEKPEGKASRQASVAEPFSSPKTVSIPFTKEGSLCKVQCTINSLPLHFLFDTGASDISMSSVEATFMLKNGYLRKQDLGGKEFYMTASGEVSEGTTVRLREVELGGFKLNNIKASIVKNQKAPLLLGQSVLRHLGKIEIDNESNTINVSI